MRKFILTLVAIHFVFFLGAVSAHGAENKPVECDLQEDIKMLTAEKEADAEAYRLLLLKVLACSVSEVQNLKTKLEALKNVEGDNLATRDEFVKELAQFELYFKTAEDELGSENKDIDKLKKLALELLTWRKENYNEAAKSIANFIFIFQSKEVVRVADARLKKISLALLDAGLLFRRDSWKEFRILLNQAQDHIEKAGELNQEAHDLFGKEMALLQATSTPPLPQEEATEEDLSVTDLLRQSLTEIREAYRIFGEIGKIVKKILG